MLSLRRQIKLKGQVSEMLIKVYGTSRAQMLTLSIRHFTVPSFPLDKIA